VGQLLSEMPHEQIVYLGDSARVPYGIKSLETVRQFALQDAAFLLAMSPKLMVVACNTASAAAIDAVERLCPVEVVDVIRPGVADALAVTDGPLGIIATEATVSSGAYQRQIALADPSRKVMSAACPLLVPMVEEGRGPGDPIVLHVLAEYLKDLQRGRLAALILGCTHYPLLAGAISKLMGPDVVLVSSAQAAAGHVARALKRTGLLARRGTAGGVRCYTTDNPDRFARLARRFIGGGGLIDDVAYVGTDELAEAYSK